MGQLDKEIKQSRTGVHSLPDFNALVLNCAHSRTVLRTPNENKTSDRLALLGMLTTLREMKEPGGRNESADRRAFHDAKPDHRLCERWKRSNERGGDCNV